MEKNITSQRQTILPVSYQCYPAWSNEDLILPARSRLCCLEPIGVGTAEVESMAGYIARLAEKHCVSPQSLLSKEVLRWMDKPCWLDSTNITKVFARNVSGVGRVTKAIAEGLEKLTCRNDLRYTTMLMWADILSSFHLLRHDKVWCPLCYEERALARQIIFEPFLWAFEAIKICVRHRQRLIDVCPYCTRKLPPLASGSRPGYCPRCRGWLGKVSAITITDSEPITEAVLEEQSWITKSIGEVLAKAPCVPAPPTREKLTASLTLCIDQASWGKINAFSQLVGIWHITLRRMVRGEMRPTLSILLQICSRLEIQLVDLLSGSNEMVISGREGVLESLRSHRAKLSPQRRAEPMELDEVEKELIAARKESPPPSISEVARRAGRPMITLQRKFPHLYAQVVARYAEQYRKALSDEDAKAMLEAALREEPPPSLQNILRRFDGHVTSSYYYDRYPDLCLAITARYKNYRNKPFNMKSALRVLRAALVKEPPSSFSEVARRLNHSRNFLRVKFPELSAAIAARYMEDRKLRNEEDKKILWEEVEEAVRNISAEGLYVSEARVIARISKQLNSVTFKQALREAKRKLGL